MQVALLSGRSAPADARPSAVQARFLAALARPDVAIVSTLFPWTGAGDDSGTAMSVDDVATSVPLWLASVRNGAQFVGSRRAAWRVRHRPHLDALLDRAPRTVLLCGSAGLELLANLRADPARLDRVDVFAYGPVARAVPPVRRLLIVQGRHDRISRLAFGSPDRLVAGGHLDYLEDPDVLALCRAFVDEARADALAARGP